MSLPHVDGRARIISDARKGRTSTGTPWANVTAKFIGWRKTDEGWEENGGVVVTLCGYDDVAVSLVSFAKGDEVEVDGRIRELTVWTPKNGGDPRPSLSITLTEVRPAEKKARGDRAANVASSPNRQGPADKPPATVTDVATYRREATSRLVRAHANTPRRSA